MMRVLFHNAGQSGEDARGRYSRRALGGNRRQERVIEARVQQVLPTQSFFTF